MSKSSKRIEQQLVQMQKLGSALKVTFLAALLLVLFFYIWTLSFGLRLINEGASIEDGLYISGTSGDISILFVSFYCLSIGALLLILFGISSDMARGQSPFTRWHARSIAMLGVLLAIIALLKLGFFSPSLASGVININEGVLVFFGAPSSFMLYLGPDKLPLDLGLLFGALMCFAISAMWWYAALLQTQSEDLV